MMQLLPKTHEQRIAELERLVAELQRVVGVPGPYGLVGGMHPQAQASGSLGEAQQRSNMLAQNAIDAATQSWGNQAKNNAAVPRSVEVVEQPREPLLIHGHDDLGTTYATFASQDVINQMIHREEAIDAENAEMAIDQSVLADALR